MNTNATYQSFLAEDYLLAKLGAGPFDELPLVDSGTAGQAVRQTLTVAMPWLLADQLTRISGGKPATTFALLLTTWFHLCEQYGLENVLVSSPGLLTDSEPNQLYFSHKATPERISLRELTQQTLHQVKDTLTHRYYDADRLRQSLTLQQPEQPKTGDGPGLALVGFTHSDDHALDSFDLSVCLDKQPITPYLHIYFRADCYHLKAIEDLAQHFLNALANVLTHPDEPTARLSILTPTETRQLLTDWNNTATQEPLTDIVADFAQQARQTPKRTAFYSGERAISFANLYQESQQLAQVLHQSYGLSANDVIGVMLPRNEILLVGLWGVLQAGAAYLPLDPTYPVSRLEYMVENSGCQLIMTTTAYADRLQIPSDCQLLVLDQPIGTELVTSILPSPKPESMAYLIYTSGSTGKPKGVRVSRGNLANFCLGMDQALPLRGGTDHLLAVTSTSFDISILELLWTLSRGIPITLVNDVYELAGSQQAEQATTLQTTPSLLRILLRNPQSTALLASLTTVLLGGEKLPADLAEGLRRHTTARLFNMYGPTETTIWSACRELRRGEEVSVGKPLANTRLYVLNRWGQLLPPGVVGEIYIGGQGVALGYHKAETLTASRFGVDPWAEDPNARMYRTGDRGYWLASGDLQVLGRADNQLKISGHRIEPGEIEAALVAYPAISQAVVNPWPDAQGTLHLAAYMVADEPLRLTPLRQHLQALLPDFMLPTWLVPLASLPLTPNGKTDRQALPDPRPLALGVEEVTLSEAQTDVQTTLRTIWQQVLERGRVGLHDNLLDLGATSIRIIQAFDSIQAEYPQRLIIANLFEYPTIAQQASLIQHQEGSPVAAQPAFETIDF